MEALHPARVQPEEEEELVPLPPPLEDAEEEAEGLAIDNIDDGAAEAPMDDDATEGVAAPLAERVMNESDSDRRAREARNREAAEKRGAGVSVSNPQEARRRLMRDLRALQTTLAGPAGETMGIVAHLVKDDLFCWHAVISGPAGTPWEGGLFRLELRFTTEYPLVPPTVQFLTPNVFHPNVYVNGNICLNTLKSCWSPSLDVEALLISIMSLLSDPNPSSAANGEAARLYVENRELYDDRICKLVEETLEQSFSDEGEEED